ncbi:MAG: hypothetical protein K6F91_01220 [Ruminococcus sp.]|nr:hypothetical protein [Ruminococcus sp.]
MFIKCSPILGGAFLKGSARILNNDVFYDLLYVILDFVGFILYLGNTIEFIRKDIRPLFLKVRGEKITGRLISIDFADPSIKSLVREKPEEEKNYLYTQYMTLRIEYYLEDNSRHLARIDLFPVLYYDRKIQAANSKDKEKHSYILDDDANADDIAFRKTLKKDLPIDIVVDRKDHRTICLERDYTDTRYWKRIIRGILNKLLFLIIAGVFVYWYSMIFVYEHLIK